LRNWNHFDAFAPQNTFDKWSGDRVDQHNTKAMIDQRLNDSRRKSASPSLDEARLRQQAIGVKLRDMFNEVVNEPVPDEFLEILRRADDKKADAE
jgi:hypothetical protein